MKIPKPYFRNIPLIGDLDVDFIIFQADYPVLFTCKIYAIIFICVYAVKLENNKDGLYHQLKVVRLLVC